MNKILTNNTINEIRAGFISYYGRLSSPSDAFYLYNNGRQDIFFNLLQMENINEFQSDAYEILYETLLKNSNAKGTNISCYIKGITLLWKYLHEDTSPYVTYKHNRPLSSVKKNTPVSYNPQEIIKGNIPVPSCAEADKYLTLWDNNPDYFIPDNVLKKLFAQTLPHNTLIEDIILKVSALNTIYNTRIISVFPVADHIKSLDIDTRLQTGDDTLINQLMHVVYDNGKAINHYSFATKYCSFHNPEAFPIYDSYVDKILKYFRDTDKFCSFGNSDLKNYPAFRNIVKEFQIYYGLEKYTVKQLDCYLWQLGKKYL